MKMLANLGKSLSKAEQRKIIGGNAPSGGTCAYMLPNGNASGTGPIVTYNVSSSTAQTMIAGVPGAHYCCDSCSQASWYHPQS